MRFSGWGAAGAMFMNRVQFIENNQDFYYRGKLQANVEYKNDIEAQIDLRMHSVDKQVEFKEYTVKFEPWKYARFKIGNMKKPFGLEELTTRDEYVAMDYSQPNNLLGEYGYAGRTVGALVYYKYSDKRPDFPVSYYAGFYKNNSFTMFALARASYHENDRWYSLGYAYQDRGGDDPVTGHAFSADAGYKTKDFETSVELFYALNPDETVRRNDSGVYSIGAKSLTRIEFDIDGDAVKKIEPYLLATFFAPDNETSKYHVLNFQLGANIYVQKDVYFRVRADGLLTKEAYSTKYETYDSSFTIEIFTRFGQ